jgi:hypothetical protein
MPFDVNVKYNNSIYTLSGHQPEDVVDAVVSVKIDSDNKINIEPIDDNTTIRVHRTNTNGTTDEFSKTLKDIKASSNSYGGNLSRKRRRRRRRSSASKRHL